MLTSRRVLRGNPPAAVAVVGHVTAAPTMPMTPAHLAALSLHIIAGSVGIIVGFIALYVAKGAWAHRKSGMLFVYAMLTMGLVGAAMAAIWGRQPASNIPMGLLMAYLVVTGLTTVRPPATRARRLEVGLMLVALGVGLTFYVGGVVAFSSGGAL